MQRISFLDSSFLSAVAQQQLQRRFCCIKDHPVPTLPNVPAAHKDEDGEVLCWYCIRSLQRAQVADRGARASRYAHVLPQACRNWACEDEVVDGLVTVVTQFASSIRDDRFLKQVGAGMVSDSGLAAI